MNQSSPVFHVAALAAALALTGCGETPPAAEPDGHDHGDAATEAAETPAKFIAGKGLRLASRTAEAIGLQTGEVEERAVTANYEVAASVFDAGPPARASAFVPPAIATELERHPPREAELLSVRPHPAGALDRIEIVFALPGAPAVGTTVALRLSGPARTGLSVPRSALLRTATGAFVYVINGDHLLRTPVQLGASDGAHHEILDGLYAGDVVATAAVEQLWLTELRLTKGGGHSH